MSLGDRLDQAAASPGDEPLPRTDFDGSTGFIQTGPMSGQPDDYDNLLREFGYDPQKVAIVGHPRVSRWQQRSRVRGTSDYETTWLSAYKFTISARGFECDLPALYAEVKKPPAKNLKHSSAKSTVVVCWADIQVGKTGNLGGLRELLDRLEEKRGKLGNYLKRAAFDRIILADCGDIIEGFSNFPAQHRTNCLSLMDQVDVAATEMWKTLRLCARFAPVDVLSVPSNHCAWRASGKNLAGKPTDDWGLHINKRLERMNEEAGLPASFHRPPDWEQTLTFEVRPGIRLGLAHGHQVNSPDQIKNWWAKMSHSGVLKVDVLLTGHFHFASLRPSGRDADTGRSSWHIQAPTLDNGSPWVRDSFGEDGDPALAVFQMNETGFDVQSFRLL